MSDLRTLRDTPFELLLAIEDRLRAAKLDAAAGQAQFWVGLGYRLGDQWLVSPREEIREVITVPPVARVPGAKPWLLGLANVRGSLLPVCDLARLTGDEPQAPARASRVLVYNSDRVPAGFLVDEVAGYRQFAPADQRRGLVESSGGLKPYLLGGFVREAQPWLAFSLHKLVRAEAFQMAGV